MSEVSDVLVADEVEQRSPADIAAAWLAAFGAAVRASDSQAVAGLFQPDGWWRDQLSFGWELRSVQGRAAIADRLAAVVGATGPIPFTASLADGTRLADGFPGLRWVQARFDFETGVARGQAVVRLTQVEGTDEWQALTLLTSMAELKGFEELNGPRRPNGVEHGANRAQTTWQQRRAAANEYADHDPQVVILGAGQSGLALAARLGQLGVDTLVVETNERVGDNWRKRYPSLVLHDPIWGNHLPYLPFPSTWPVFIPKDKLADWFESYAATLELNVWTSSRLTAAEHDPANHRWTVTVQRGDGTVRELRPAHLVLATGLSGRPRRPAVAGQDEYRGELLHSSEVDTGRPREGKSVVIVGAGNSAHDIAHDLVEHGAAVTMVQRSTTYVMSSKNGIDVLAGGGIEPTGVPLDELDLLGMSFPTKMLLEVGEKYLTPEIARRDADMLAGLAAAGFRTNTEGLQKLFLTRGGGYYIDVGASARIVDGTIKVRSGVEIERFTPTGVVYTDGTSQDADTVVLATGYTTMNDVARELLGDAVADRCGPVWGLDDEGELRSVWRRSGHEGLWFMAGNLTNARRFSKFLALQIKAIEEGLVSR